MKLQSIHFNQVGPLGNRSIDFTDDWTGDLHTRILLSGPNGCGKSTVLRAVAMLWEAAGHWIDNPGRLLFKGHPAAKSFDSWGGLALILQDVLPPTTGTPAPHIGLFYGDTDLLDRLRSAHPEVQWLGERKVSHSRSRPHLHEPLLLPADLADRLQENRRKMLVDFSHVCLPNVIFLDAEARQWKKPRTNIGKYFPESSPRRWLPTYEVTDNWDGQLEASLINMKLTQPERFVVLLNEFNLFLYRKQILPDIEPGESRLRVKLHQPEPAEQHHTLDDLSSGERQVLIILYMIARWAEPGAVVMVDEPDLHLHPSLVTGLLSRCEQMVKARGGQWIVTSHSPQVWSRYESIGYPVGLEGAT